VGACATPLAGSNERALVAVSTRYLSSNQGGWQPEPGACGHCMVRRRRVGCVGRMCRSGWPLCRSGRLLLTEARALRDRRPTQQQVSGVCMPRRRPSLAAHQGAGDSVTW
jgi:hypothetical protein